MKICIATPFYNMAGWSPYINSLVTTIYYLTKKNIKFDFMSMPNDCYIWRGRNLIANEFMKTDCTDLLFIDSDIQWTIESLIKIINSPEDVVGANYPCKGLWHEWAACPDYDENKKLVYNDRGLIKTLMMATGFLKIKKSVFERLSQTGEYFFSDDQRLYDFFSHLKIGHKVFGEDNSFSIRCKKIGIDIWIDPDCDITHYGYKGHEGNYKTYLADDINNGSILANIKTALKDINNE